MKKFLFIIILCCTILSACGSGMGGKNAGSPGPFELSGASMMAAKAGEMTGAFVTIKNNSGKADRLIGAESNAADMTMVHETTMENNVMSMHKVDGIDLPAGGVLELKHGGYHIMMMGLKKELKAGDMVMVTLKFEQAGNIPISMMVMAK